MSGLRTVNAADEGASGFRNPFRVVLADMRKAYVKKRLLLALFAGAIVVAVVAFLWFWSRNASLTTDHPAPSYSPGQFDRQPPPPQRYPFRQDGKMGYIDEVGKVVIPAKFDRAW